MISSYRIRIASNEFSLSGLFNKYDRSAISFEKQETLPRDKMYDFIAGKETEKN